MITALRRLLRNTDAAAAVEAAVFSPFFVLLTLGVTDLGSGMLVRMTANAAAQSGAAYAVIHSGTSGVCANLSAACTSGIEQAMNNAVGNSSFCTGAVCSASFTTCADPNGGICYTVKANYPYTPILPDVVYSWAQGTTFTSTVTVRIQ